MKQGLSFLPAKMGIGIAQDEANCSKEVTLAGTIATDDYIVFWGEGLDDRLVLVAFEALYDYLLDIHLRGARCENLNDSYCIQNITQPAISKKTL